ncbi:hypothetical protein CIB48_g8130 [Xylaria polymorpha]|nr:hypothetical protein CIB48_g8130 [Xylaria polymorpha]
MTIMDMVLQELESVATSLVIYLMGFLGAINLQSDVGIGSDRMTLSPQLLDDASTRESKCVPLNGAPLETVN